MTKILSVEALVLHSRKCAEAFIAVTQNLVLLLLFLLLLLQMFKMKLSAVSSGKIFKEAKSS